MRVAVLGNGGFGTAMAIVQHAGGHEVAMWGHDRDYTERIARERRNPRYLPEDFEVPSGITISSEPQEVLDGADVVLCAVPAQHVRGVFERLGRFVPPGVPVVSLTKGIEQGSGSRPSQVVREVLGSAHEVLVLSGPSHAEELTRGLPATVVLAGERAESRRSLQAALATAVLRIYRNPDVLGVELCGALKNVMALAAGMGEGLGFGDNAKAAIVARGIAEMARYGVAEGASLHTFFGLAGVGDLAVTAFSPHGRNRAFGVAIGRGATLEEVLASTPKVAEGVWTSRVVRDRARRLGVEMPITDAVCGVLFEGLEPRRAVHRLMERDPKREDVM